MADGEELRVSDWQDDGDDEDDDGDFVPVAEDDQDEDIVNGEPEDPMVSEAVENPGKKRGAAADSKQSTTTKKRKRPGLQLDDESDEPEAQKPAKVAKTEETDEEPKVPAPKPKTAIDDMWAQLSGGSSKSSNTPKSTSSTPAKSAAKAEVDDLWAALNPGAKPTPPKPAASAPGAPESAPATTTPTKPAISSLEAELAAAEPNQPEKVIITEKFDFAGEIVEVQRQVAVNSVAAKKAAAPPPKPAGLSSMLEQMKGKKKMNSLDKSQHDWTGFRTEAGIVDELEQNKKDGYLEKQAFLQRADWRQFDAERDARAKASRGGGGSGM